MKLNYLALLTVATLTLCSLPAFARPSTGDTGKFNDREITAAYRGLIPELLADVPAGKRKFHGAVPVFVGELMERDPAQAADTVEIKDPDSNVLRAIQIPGVEIIPQSQATRWLKHAGPTAAEYGVGLYITPTYSTYSVMATRLKSGLAYWCASPERPEYFRSSGEIAFNVLAYGNRLDITDIDVGTRDEDGTRPYTVRSSSVSLRMQDQEKLFQVVLQDAISRPLGDVSEPTIYVGLSGWVDAVGNRFYSKEADRLPSVVRRKLTAKKARIEPATLVPSLRERYQRLHPKEVDFSAPPAVEYRIQDAEWLDRNHGIVWCWFKINCLGDSDYGEGGYDEYHVARINGHWKITQIVAGGRAG